MFGNNNGNNGNNNKEILIKCDECGEEQPISMCFYDDVIGEYNKEEVRQHGIECAYCGTQYPSFLTTDTLERLKKEYQELIYNKNVPEKVKVNTAKFLVARFNKELENITKAVGLK